MEFGNASCIIKYIPGLLWRNNLRSPGIELLQFPETASILVDAATKHKSAIVSYSYNVCRAEGNSTGPSWDVSSLFHLILIATLDT